MAQDGQGLRLVAGGGGVRLSVAVQPKAKKDEIAGVIDGRLKIKLTVPPVGGKANKALIAFLAKRLGVAKSRIRIVKGEKSRQKEIVVEGVGEKELERML